MWTPIIIFGFICWFIAIIVVVAHLLSEDRNDTLIESTRLQKTFNETDGDTFKGLRIIVITSLSASLSEGSVIISEFGVYVIEQRLLIIFHRKTAQKLHYPSSVLFCDYTTKNRTLMIKGITMNGIKLYFTLKLKAASQLQLKNMEAALKKQLDKLVHPE